MSIVIFEVISMCSWENFSNKCLKNAFSNGWKARENTYYAQHTC